MYLEWTRGRGRLKKQTMFPPFIYTTLRTEQTFDVICDILFLSHGARSCRDERIREVKGGDGKGQDGGGRGGQ